MPEQGIAVVEVSGLPEAAGALFPRDDPFSTPAWYRATAAYAVPEGAAAVFYVAREAGRVVAVVPMLRGPGRRLASLASPYASVWHPLFCEAAGHDPAWVRRIGLAVGGALRAAPVVRMDALDGDAVFLAPFVAGFRQAGFQALRFDHFGNWHQALPPTWAEFLAARPAHLRATIRRRGRRLLADADARFSVIDTGADLDQGIADYDSVYAASWKQAEPFRMFVGEYMREAAQGRTLRLFLLHVKDRPVAAQVWIVQGGCGHLLKLAHLESERALSPGTVLTAHAIEYLMAHDEIRRIDFGRGDDAYKRLWTGERRQRIGFVFANPGTLAGAAAIARHVAGTVRRSLMLPAQSGLPEGRKKGVLF